LADTLRLIRPTLNLAEVLGRLPEAAQLMYLSYSVCSYVIT